MASAPLCSRPPYALRPVLDLAGPQQITFGSDFLYVPAPLVAREVRELAALDLFDVASRQAMEEGNALALFPRLAQRLEAATGSGQ